jgi:outer membrane protein TolC
VVIDKDRTSVLFNQAERTLAGGGSLSQLIYSDRAWAGYTIEKRLQESRVYGRESLRLDIALDASTAYLDVLRAKTFERIEKENLELSRANLELARVREAIGQAGPEEVYRWEAQIANNRRAVIRTNAARNLLEIELNRLLHRPLEESFAIDDVDLQHPGLSTGHSGYTMYMNDPWSFKILRSVLVDLGLAASPELRQIDAAIAAQERAYSAAGRSFWLPTFGVQGDISQNLEQDGEGSEAPPASEVPGITIPDDTDWNVAVVGTLPLLEGGGRFAERARTSELVAQLEIERAATEERLEQRIRSAMHRVGASYASIQQAQLAAAASRRNLDLVTDSYSQGVMSIIQLIDAQNQALVAEQTAATSVYDFLIDLMEVQRSINQFDFFGTAEDRAAWFERLNAAFERKAAEMGEGR